MNTHTCIKPGCGKSYQDGDVDAYYCAECKLEKDKIAAEIDANLANRPKGENMSGYQIALARGQQRGDGLFVRASDLGL